MMFIRCFVWSSLSFITSGLLVLTAFSDESVTVALLSDSALRFPREPIPFTLHEKQPSVEMILSFDWL